MLKKIQLYTIFFFALFPITGYSQTSLYKLPKGKTGLGLAFSTAEDVSTVNGSLDYGIDKYLKVSFIAGVGLIADDVYNKPLEVPPAPAGGLAIVRVDSLGETGLDYFLKGSFSAMFSRVVRTTTDETFVKTRTLGLTGGGGLLKRLRTQSGWSVNPFFGLYYSNAWQLIEQQRTRIEEALTDGNIAGEAGVEIEVSRTTSIVGSLIFSFESSDTVFNIAVNLH